MELALNERTLLRALIRSNFSHFKIVFSINCSPFVIGENGAPIQIDSLGSTNLPHSIQRLAQHGLLSINANNSDYFELTDLGKAFEN